MRLKHCYNTRDFRELARRRLPAALFHYIDGAADDEVTCRRNTEAFESCDLVPNVLTGVTDVDLTTTVLGQQLDVPLFFSPTAMQRLFHPHGEYALARAGEKFGTLYGLSTIGTRSIEEMGSFSNGPKLFQIYVHKDTAFTSELISRCKAANFNALALTVDTIVAGNRERDFIYGMTTPPKLTLKSLVSFALHPFWTLSYLFSDNFDLPNVGNIEAGRKVATSIVDYLDNQIERCIRWDDASKMIEEWGGPFAIKGIMSVADAKMAVQVGASAIMISNHGGRQLDGSRAPFDQLPAIADAVGGDIEIIVDGGIRRGTHVLKALALGATACSGGRMYLYALAAAGTAGVERAFGLIRDEIERDMALMGCKRISDLNASMVAGREVARVSRAAAT